jgi:hypothetical protein
VATDANFANNCLYVFDRKRKTRVCGFVRANSHKMRHKSGTSISAVNTTSKTLSIASHNSCRRVFGNCITNVAPRCRTLVFLNAELLSVEDEEELELVLETAAATGGCM